jgi:hypothetical protein
MLSASLGPAAPAPALAAALVLSCLALGCSSKRESDAAAVSDCTGSLCTPGSSVGGGVDAGAEASGGAGGSAADAAGGSAQTAALAGKLVQFADDRFRLDSVIDYVGGCTLSVPSGSAGSEDVVVAAGAANTFTVAKARLGPGWLHATPPAGDAGLLQMFPTWSYLTIPQGATDFLVPLVGRTPLQVLYGQLGQPLQVNPAASQVIVAFERQGARLSGVKITDYPTSEAVAFDQGVGYAAADPKVGKTGTLGVVILINLTGGSARLTYQLGAYPARTLSPLVTTKGEASFVLVEVP